jgi:protoporphyrinogen oxidase
MQVMSLTEAAKPRTFHSQIWYRDTTNSLKNFQIEAAQRDDEEKQKRRQVYMDQLKEELKEISNANTDVYEVGSRIRRMCVWW